MTIYVDDFYKWDASIFRGMRMSHMIGTDETELHKFAKKIGLWREWYQSDHYDISMSIRRSAVLLGAVEVTARELACMHSLRVMGYDMGEPKTAPERRVEISKQATIEGTPENIRRTKRQGLP